MRRINLICIAMEKWFREHDLLEIDNQCGIQRKEKRAPGLKKGPVKRVYRIEHIVPSREPVRFKENKLVISLMKDCFKIDRYRHEINDDQWTLAYLRKKLVAFVIVRGNKIIRACVAKGYRRQNHPKEVMAALTQAARVSIIELDNRDKLYRSVLRMYKTFGFAVTKDDGRTTTLEYTAPE